MYDYAPFLGIIMFHVNMATIDLTKKYAVFECQYANYYI